MSDAELPQASYLLMRYIPGTVNPDRLLKTAKLPAKTLTAIGKCVATVLATLHEQTFPYMRSSATRYKTWGEAMQLEQLAARSPFSAAWLEKLEHSLETTHYRRFSRGHLIHSDANLNNVLVDEKDYSFRALIDPGPTMIGMPMFDLAYAAWPWQYGLDYMITLTETYQQLSPHYNETLFYTSLMLIAYQQAEYGNFTAEHLAFLERHIEPNLNV